MATGSLDGYGRTIKASTTVAQHDHAQPPSYPLRDTATRCQANEPPLSSDRQHGCLDGFGGARRDLLLALPALPHKPVTTTIARLSLRFGEIDHPSTLPTNIVDDVLQRFLVLHCLL